MLGFDALELALLPTAGGFLFMITRLPSGIWSSSVVESSGSRSSSCAAMVTPALLALCSRGLELDLTFLGVESEARVAGALEEPWKTIQEHVEL